MTQNPWAGILDANERILWQGQPDTRIDWRRVRPLPTLMGGVFAFVGITVVVQAIADLFVSGIGALPQIAIGLLFAGIGLRISVGAPLLDAYARSQTWYTLTNARMLVATGTFGKRQLRDCAITPTSGLIYEDGTPGSVLIEGNDSVGFHRIDEARHVYGLVRKVQQGQA